MNLPPYEQFDCHAEGAAVRWPRWVRRLEHIFDGYEIDSSKRRYALTLTYGGPDLNDIVESLPTIDTIQAAEEPYNDLIKALTDHFNPRSNLEILKYEFRHKQQKQFQRIDDFYSELRQLASQCNFTNANDEIKSQLISGCLSKKVREKGLTTSTLDLAGLLHFARSLEMTEEFSKKLTNDTPQQMSRVKTAGSKKHEKHFKGVTAPVQDTRPPNKFYTHRPTGGQRQNCHRCGKGHPHDHCPAKGRTCHKCHKANHFAKMCRSNIREVTEEFEQTFSIDTVISEKSPPWSTTLNIQNTNVPFKVDTGADITCITQKTFQVLVTKPILHHCKLNLTSPGGNIQVKGQFTAKTKRKGKTFEFRVVVLNNKEGSNLLSRNVAEALGLIRHIEDTECTEKSKPEERKQVFGAVGLLKTEPVKITLTKDAEPYNVATARRVPFPLERKVKEELDRMERHGVIRKVNEPTEWCAPMVPVIKPNKQVRICVDFKKLNLSVKRNYCMLPNLEDIAPNFVGATVFSTLDATSGFFQIPLDEECSMLTTFITPFGKYCFQRVPMGISLGPEVFQSKMKETLEGLPGCEVIMDDTIIYGKDEQDHDRKLETVLERIEKSGLKLNKEKCRFRQEEVKYFGHLINKNGIKPNPDKVEAIQKLPPPTSLTELRTVCGLLNYMSKFVPSLATILKPLTELMKKSVKFQWVAEQDNAFNLAKKKIAETTTLGFFDINCETIVSADSSSFGLGAVLLQKKGSKLQPIAFASRTLTETEKGYAQIEKECLASVYACEKFEKYLIGLDNFELQTDHKPLVPLMRNKDLDKCPARCQRLLMRLMRFNLNVTHVPGKELVIADALSRGPMKYHTTQDKEIVQNVEAYVEALESSWPVTASRLENLREGSKKDTDIQKIMHFVMDGWPKEVPETLKKFQQVQGELSVVNGLLVFNNRIVVPLSQRDYILSKLHETHQGIEKCRQNADASVWWPDITRDIKNMVQNCFSCRENRPAQRNEPLMPTDLPERPWQKIAVDLATHGKK